MGTPEFAVPSLDILYKNEYNIVGVVTSVDKPAGRGMKLQHSAVKKYALDNNLNILQPPNLKSEDFKQELINLQPDLQVVVAYRMLPESVWKLPSKGTINLHGSLLPNYRGAAPINWAVINGEQETGLTTFFINENIDTGKILFFEKEKILEKDTAGTLHDRMMYKGADLLLKTVNSIYENNYTPIEQNSLITDLNQLKSAPKIFKENCRINWENNNVQIYDFIRGLSPYPAAFTEIISPLGEKYYFKIFSSEKIYEKHNLKVGKILTDEKKFLKISTTDGYISLKEIQLTGKNRLNIEDFLRGFHINFNWKILNFE